MTHLVNGHVEGAVGEPARRLPRARAGDRPHGDDPRRPARRPRSGPSARGSPARASRRSACSPRSIPVITLAADGTDRVMFGGAFVVDNYALAFKGFFLVVAYVVLLLSSDYIADGDYYQGEFYFLMLTSVLGMMVMASARDLDHDLRGAGDDHHPHVRARRLAQARHEVERSRRSSTSSSACCRRRSCSTACRSSSARPAARRCSPTSAATSSVQRHHARCSRSRSS